MVSLLARGAPSADCDSIGVRSFGMTARAGAYTQAMNEDVLTVGAVGLVLIGAAIGFLSAWGLEALRKASERRSQLSLVKRELRLLIDASTKLTAQYDAYDPTGRYPKAHSFAWGGRATLRLLRSIAAAYTADRSRFVLPSHHKVADELFDLVLFLEAVGDNLQRHLENLDRGELPSPRVGDNTFRELRERAQKLVDEL